MEGEESSAPPRHYFSLFFALPEPRLAWHDAGTGYMVYPPHFGTVLDKLLSGGLKNSAMPGLQIVGGVPSVGIVHG